MTTGIVIDADLSLAHILKGRQETPAPEAILESQVLLPVIYPSFDGRFHRGQFVVDRDLVSDLQQAFELVRDMNFPVSSVIPLLDRTDMSPEEYKTSLNNSSGFNYRRIRGGTKLSAHALGRGIDLNPFLNPYIHHDVILPAGAGYDPNIPGTLAADGLLVRFFREKGWVWGGDWTDRKDYMHFEKGF